MVSEEIRRLQATMDGLVREQSDRRALRERQGEEIKARAQEYMTKQVQAAERYVQLRRELGKQEQEADEPSDGITELDFEPEGFAESEEDTPQPAASPTQTAPPTLPASPTQTAPHPPTEPHAPTAPHQETAPPAPPAPLATAPTRPSRRPVAAEEEEDDDDFLNNRWMDDA